MVYRKFKYKHSWNFMHFMHSHFFRVTLKTKIDLAKTDFEWQWYSFLNFFLVFPSFLKTSSVIWRYQGKNYDCSTFFGVTRSGSDEFLWGRYTHKCSYLRLTNVHQSENCFAQDRIIHVVVIFNTTN